MISQNPQSVGHLNISINSRLSELFVYLCRHLKLELLAQFPASNDDTNVYF